MKPESLSWRECTRGSESRALRGRSAFYRTCVYREEARLASLRTLAKLDEQNEHGALRGALPLSSLRGHRGALA